MSPEDKLRQAPQAFGASAGGAGIAMPVPAPQPTFPQHTAPQPQAQYAPPQPPYTAPQPQHAQHTASQPQHAPAPSPSSPQLQSDPFRAPDPFAAPPAAAAHAAAPVAQAPQGRTGNVPVQAPAPGSLIPSPPAGNLPTVNADLGAHSPTNFYKGLSGNDIIDHGGLFVATYKIPKMNTEVRLRIALPGGYEFEANAVVRWVREHAEGSDSPPGFGAQFSAISPEARQLVYRYVRNREPIFHDDL